MPLKHKRCEHQWPTELNCQPAFLNKYHCDHCDQSWEDHWSCGCDCECPSCGKDFSPVSSEEVAACACEFL